MAAVISFNVSILGQPFLKDPEQSGSFGFSSSLEMLV